MTSRAAYDAVVVGGGAAGCATALELAKRGLSVTLVERDSVGSHASGFAYGGLFATTGTGIPGPLLPVARRGVEMHRKLAPELAESTGIDVELRERDTLDVALTDDELSALLKEAEWQRQEGFRVTELDAQEVLDYEPTLTPNIVGGVLQEDHYELDSYRYTLALATTFEKSGGTIRHGSVAGLEASGGTVNGVRLTSNEVVAAGAVVIATGPWAGGDEISGLAGLPVTPLKGEIVRLGFPGDSFERRVSTSLGYLARKPDGMIWAGTTYEAAGFDDQPSTEARDSILEHALQMAPELESAEVVQQTACLRPRTPDELPAIGPIGDVDGVYFVGGGGSNGILLSPVMGAMAAALVVGRPNEDPVPAELSVERFRRVGV